MSDKITDQRLRDYLAFSEAEKDDEMVAILTELNERRQQSGYSREQRLSFMLRMIKDINPEVSKELREIYHEQENNIYYARREVTIQRVQREKETTLLRGYLRDAMSFITPLAAGDYELWKEAVDDRVSRVA